MTYLHAGHEIQDLTNFHAGHEMLDLTYFHAGHEILDLIQLKVSYELGGLKKKEMKDMNVWCNPYVKRAREVIVHDI